MSARRNSNIPAIPIAMLFVCISMMFVVLGSATSGWVRSGFWAASLVFGIIGLMGALRNLRRVQQEAATVRARLDDDSADGAADR